MILIRKMQIFFGGLVCKYGINNEELGGFTESY